MSEQLALLPGYLTAHLRLTLVALGAGFALSVPAGIWLTRRPRYEQPVLGIVSVIQTIPGLALLAVMVPTLAALSRVASGFGMELRSIGFLPAILALTLYSMLPILRNTLTGIRGVDPALIEAARGVGMTDRQQLWRVELPLALPVIVAGVRTATVWVVGTATLSTPVGATSLGNFIFSGLQTRNLTAVLVGCVAAAGLAMLLDQLVRGLEVGLRDGRRRTVAGLLAVLALLGAAAGAEALRAGLGRGERPLVIGSKNFTEQYILSEVLAQQVRDLTGRATRAVPALGSTVAFDALRSDQLDAYVDYSGTLWATILHRDALPAERDQVLREVTRHLAERYGIVVAAALGFENTYALAMRADHAEALGIRRISDLARHAPALEIGADIEFFQRPEWREVRRTYGLAFARRRSMDPALMYQALAAGEVDVISAFSTDGRIAAFGLRLLADDRGVIPPYDTIVLASRRLARDDPDALEALRSLDGTLTEARMQQMNLAVDRDGRSPAEVAAEFLRDLGRPGTGG